MSTAQSVVKSDIQSRVADAVHRAQAYLSAQQNLEGYWWAELEANVTLTAEYVMLHRILIAADPRNKFGAGKDREEQIRQMARYILREQRPHGGWELFYGDGGEICTMASWARSSTVPLLVVIDKKPVYDLGVYADELFV